MAQVLGIGGVFFKSSNPKTLGEWYHKWLGVPVEHPWGASFAPVDLPPGALGVWNPFAASTTYFQPSPKDFMVNLIVDDVGGALATLLSSWPGRECTQGPRRAGQHRPLDIREAA